MIGIEGDSGRKCEVGEVCVCVGGQGGGMKVNRSSQSCEALYDVLGGHGVR